MLKLLLFVGRKVNAKSYSSKKECSRVAIPLAYKKKIMGPD